jgi:hypothetical protein
MPLAAFARTRELLDMDFPGRPAFWQSGYSLIPDFARRANIFSDTSLALALPGNPNTAVSFGIGMDRNGSRWSPIIPIRPIFSDPPNIPMSGPPVSLPI